MSDAAPANDEPQLYVTGFSTFPGVPTNPTEVLINRLRRHKQSLGQEAAFGPRVSLRCATVLRVAARSMRQWVERLFGELEATAGTGGGQPAAGTAPAQEDGPGRRDAAVPTRRRAALAQEAGERGEPPPPELPLPPPQGGGPVLVLHLGVDDRGECFKLERRAVNDATFRVPDMDGFRPSHEPVDGKLELGAKLRTDLDLISLRDRLRARCSSPLRISHDAGRYVCNWTYFLSLEHAQVAREAGRAVHVLFVHVPPFRVIPEAQQFAFLLELLSQLAMLLAAPRPAAERAAQTKTPTRQPGTRLRRKRRQRRSPRLQSGRAACCPACARSSERSALLRLRCCAVM